MPISNAMQFRRRMAPLVLRSRVWLGRHRLDELLAEGATPEEAPQLRSRAFQLVSPTCRRSVADALERVLEDASEPCRGFTAKAPLQRREIAAAAALLHEIASALRDAEPVNARGVAMAERLLTDGASPIYSPAQPGTLEDALRHIHAALLLA